MWDSQRFQRTILFHTPPPLPPPHPVLSYMWGLLLIRICHCNENPIYVFLFWELRGFSPNFHIHVSVSDLYIPRIAPHIFLQQNRKIDRGNIAHRHMNMEIELGLWPRNSFSGIICFQFFGIGLCSVKWSKASSKINLIRGEFSSGKIGSQWILS